MQAQLTGFHLGRFLALGVLLVIGLLLSYQSGFFRGWQPIDPPPISDFHFAGVYQKGWGSGNLVIRAADGMLYGYLRRGDAYFWSYEISAGQVVAAICRSTGFIARITQPFQTQTGCLQTIVPTEWTGGPRVTYVRDEHGRLWMWQEENASILLWLTLPALLLGLAGGYLLALLWNSLALLLRPIEPAARPARWQALFAWLERTTRAGARVWSLFSVLVLFAISLLPEKSTRPYAAAGLIFTLSLLVGLVALGMAWRWERLGACLALLAFLAGLVTWIQISAYQWLTALIVLSLLYLPALLFLTSGVLKGRGSIFYATGQSGKRRSDR